MIVSRLTEFEYSTYIIISQVFLIDFYKKGEWQKTLILSVYW